jgi:predicted RNA-binding Zn ribbon-like protein
LLVDFGHYRDDSVALATDLVNTSPGDGDLEELGSVEDLVRWLAVHGLGHLGEDVEAAELQATLELRRRLRGVFQAPTEAEAAALLNRLVAEAGSRPELATHDGRSWHLHVVPARPGPAPYLQAVAAMALSFVLADFGLVRLGVCAERTCEDVFVDTSKNSSRRYCSEGCANRANVRNYRARARETFIAC